MDVMFDSPTARTHRQPSARVDDLIHNESFVFSDCETVLEAHTRAEVADVLGEVERASASGFWAVGFVSYDAADGLDPALKTTRSCMASKEGDDVAEVFAHADQPMCWFGLFRSRQIAAPLSESHTGDPYRLNDWRTSLNFEQYGEGVEKIRHLLEMGETYQINFTFRFQSFATGDLFECYRDLALKQRGAHNMFIDTGRFVVASASPELFFEWTDQTLVTRPMKGTAARGSSPEQDRDNCDWLAASEKNLAENVMIVDLVRNDLGRVAEFGSIEVPALFTMECYETLWQMTSTVRATTVAGTSLVDIFRALFPSGSVTGAPKYRAMEIISGLESHPRGLYCGAIGVVAPSGSDFRAKFNVAIRTLVIDRATGRALYGTGGGITIGSEVAEEFAEALAKAAILTQKHEEFSLLETMAIVPGQGVRYRSDHLARLKDAATHFGFSMDIATVDKAIDHAITDVTQASRLRLLVDRDGGLEILLTAFSQSDDGFVSLIVDYEPILSTDASFRFKTTCRNAFESRKLRHPGVDDVLMINERGEITETTIANLVVLIDGAWCTPPLASGCLPGIARARLVLNEIVHERVIYPSELSSTTTLGVVSSLRGFRRARLLEAP